MAIAFAGAAVAVGYNTGADRVETIQKAGAHRTLLHFSHGV